MCIKNYKPELHPPPLKKKQHKKHKQKSNVNTAPSNVERKSHIPLRILIT